MKTEPMINSCDSTGEQSRSNLNGYDDMDEWTKRKPGFIMTREQIHILNNIKMEEDWESMSVKMNNMKKEEGWESLSVKMESKDGVKDEKGFWKEEATEWDELWKSYSIDRKLEKNRVKSENEQQEEDESSMLVFSCLTKQPRVLIRRLQNSNNSVSVPSLPCALGCKGDRGATSLLKQQKLSPLVDNGSLSPGVAEKTVGQSEVPLNLLPSSSENGICNTASSSSPVITSSCQNTGQTAEVSSQVFTCPQCPFSHLEEMSLRKHIENIHPEELSRTQRSQQPPSSPHQDPTLTQSRTSKPGAAICSQCGKSFANKYVLKFHKKIHEEHQYHCSYCDKTFAFPNRKVEHERIHTGERPYCCSKCDKTYTTNFLLKRHQQVHKKRHQQDEHPHAVAPGPALHACPQCGKKFRTKCSLFYHKNLHKEHQFRCSHCSKTFARADKLRLHERTHTGERPYPCSQCDKTFSRPDKLKIHQRVHTGERPYSCSHCGKKFTQSNGLKVHLLTHTGERPYPCSQCTNSYATRRSLTFHQRTHTNECPFRCLQCGKRYVVLRSLKRHQQRNHTPRLNAQTKRPGSSKTASVAEHKLPQCKQRYKSKSLLKSHLGTHGENLYRCSHCNKSFSFHCRLREHERTHTGKHPYRCSQCDKGFRRRYHLKIHMRIHTGERPYSCGLCGKKFSTSCSLKYHKGTHTTVRAHRCTQCKMSFSALHFLKHHQQVHTD